MTKEQKEAASKKGSPKFSVVPNHVDTDTITSLERLLKEARAGQVIGVAFVALMRRRHYITHACGEVLRDRVYTRGMLRELDEQLGGN